jgi:hypothetical protein
MRMYIDVDAHSTNMYVPLVNTEHTSNFELA